MSASSFDLQTTLSNILQYLGELDRKVDRVDRKIDLLWSQSTQPWVNDMSGVHNPFPAQDIDWNSSSFDQTPLKPAGKTLDPIVTSLCMVPTVPSGPEVWQGGPSQFEELKPLGFSSDPYVLQSDPVSSSTIFEDFPPLSPRKLSAPMIGAYDMRVDREPPQTPPPPNPLPRIPPSYEAGSYSEYDGGSFDGNHNFTSGEYNDHPSTQQWADDLSQEAESSAGSTAAQPENEENDVQPESSSSASQRSAREKEKRRNRKREQNDCLSRICDAKGIVWTGDKLSALQNIIVKMGWTIPEKGRPNGKGISKDKACTACFEELKKRVGLFGERAELKILERVLAWARNGDREPPEASGSRQIVFSLG